MKLLTISLGVLGLALILWGLLGFNVVWTPDANPDLTTETIDEIRWAATRELLLGLSFWALAWFLYWRKSKKGAA